MHVARNWTLEFVISPAEPQIRYINIISCNTGHKTTTAGTVLPSQVTEVMYALNYLTCDRSSRVTAILEYIKTAVPPSRNVASEH